MFIKRSWRLPSRGDSPPKLPTGQSFSLQRSSSFHAPINTFCRRSRGSQEPATWLAEFLPVESNGLCQLRCDSLCRPYALPYACVSVSPPSPHKNALVNEAQSKSSVRGDRLVNTGADRRRQSWRCLSFEGFGEEVCFCVSPTIFEKLTALMAC